MALDKLQKQAKNAQPPRKKLTFDGSRRELLKAALHARDSYGLVLGLLVVTFFLNELVHGPVWTSFVVLSLNAVVVLFAMHTSNVSQRTLRIGFAISGASILIGLIVVIADNNGMLSTPNDTATAVVSGAQIVLLAIAAPATVTRILRHPYVDVESILGAISAYIMFGLFFTSVFAFIGAFQQFFVEVAKPHIADYQFFSFVTLTTVGYGNLVPKTRIGESMSAAEALLGQVYLVTLVARLVSVFGTQKPENASDEKPE